jgi:hypothetical protein
MAAAPFNGALRKGCIKMPLKSLLEKWKESSQPITTKEHFSVRLPLDDAARVLALSELFPGKTPESIITDILSVALAEIEAQMPYVQGDKVIRRDEYGDPVFDDAGMTPLFLDLIHKHLQQLE